MEFKLAETLSLSSANFIALIFIVSNRSLKLFKFGGNEGSKWVNTCLQKSWNIMPVLLIISDTKLSAAKMSLTVYCKMFKKSESIRNA